MSITYYCFLIHKVEQLLVNYRLAYLTYLSFKIKQFSFFFTVLELNAKGAWTQISYSQSFEPFKKVIDNVPRLEESTTSPEEFIEKYEKPYLPVVIRGSQDSWKARHKWTVEVRFSSST